jgi:hypothetical protein
MRVDVAAPGSPTPEEATTPGAAAPEATSPGVGGEADNGASTATGLQPAGGSSTGAVRDASAGVSARASGTGSGAVSGSDSSSAPAGSGRAGTSESLPGQRAGGGQGQGGSRTAGGAPTPPAATPAPGAPEPSGPKVPGPESGQGFTASTINIGITLIDETASRGAGLIGAKNTNFGNTRLQAQSIVDHVNANGGIGGRKVVPVFHTINILSETWDTSAQGSCSAFTEDNKTVAGIAAVIQLSEVFTHCLARHNTIAVVNGRGVRDDRMLGELGDLVSMPARLSATRWGTLTVDGLAELGYFDAGAKVGLVRFDTAPLNRTVADVMKPRLAARKVSVVADEIISHPDSVNGFGATSAQISNAVLRMRSAGVTHVLPIDDHGIMVYLLLPQAESQGFRPRYGVSTNNLPFVMEENAPKEQLKGTVGVGWLPGDDVAEARTPDNPAEKTCAGIFKRAGAELPSRYAYSNAMNYCDSLLFLQAAFGRAPSLTVAGFRAGAAALGSSYASPYTFATDFGRKRVDGPSAWRAFRFQPDCTCFRYEGGNRPL